MRLAKFCVVPGADAPLEAQQSAPADCCLDRAVVDLGAIDQPARLRHIARLHSSSHPGHVRAPAIQAACVDVQGVSGQNEQVKQRRSVWRRCCRLYQRGMCPLSCMAHHEKFLSRRKCRYHHQPRAPCLTRKTRPKSLQGNEPRKARSAQHASTDTHMASAVALRVSAVTGHDVHANLIAECQPQAQAGAE